MHGDGLDAQPRRNGFSREWLKIFGVKTPPTLYLRRRRHACLARLKYGAVINTSREINFTPTKWNAR